MTFGDGVINRQGYDHLRDARCTVCKTRITTPTDPYCGQICGDSARAESRRELEMRERWLG